MMRLMGLDPDGDCRGVFCQWIKTYFSRDIERRNDVGNCIVVKIIRWMHDCQKSNYKIFLRRDVRQD